jgi:hypothetical protein
MLGQNKIWKLSRLSPGSYFAAADLAGRKLGSVVAERAWQKAHGYFEGTARPSLLELTASGDVN